MQITSTLAALALLAVGINAIPAPLNINLGAYSPALVVGDGALTFGGGEAEAGAGGEGKGKGGGKGKGEGEGAAAAAAAAAAAGIPAQQGLKTRNGASGKVEKRQNSGFDRALTFAESALTKGPKVQLGTGEGGAGVGIIVDPSTAAGGAAGGGAAGGGAAGGGEGKGKGGGKNGKRRAA